MAISSTQITDYLFKKVGYSVAKTDTSTAKYPFNESIASPLLTPGRYVWQQDYYIPTVTSAPTSNTVVNGSTIVTVYNASTSTVVQATALSESVSQETWSTGITNWIPPSFGSGYQLKLYAGPPGASAATVAANFTQLPVAGSGANDSWFFDYQAGIVNFADTSVPAAAANVSNVVYAMGAVYTGTLGVTNYGNLTVSGISISGNTISGNASGITIASNTSVGNLSVDSISPYKNAVTVFNSNAAIGLPVGTNSTYPSSNSAGYFRFNSSVSTVEFYNGSNWIPFTNTISDQQITPDGVNSSFTLNQAASTQGLLVSINGTVQRPGTAYTVSGTTITFAEVPSITDIIDIRYIASATAVTLTGLGEDISTSGNITGNVIQANILSVSSVTANLIGNVVGNLTGNVRADTVYANTAIVSSGNITVNTTATIIDSFNSSLYRSAKYIISSTTPYDSQFAEVALTQFGSTVVTTAYALLNTGANTVTFTANINGSTVNLLAQGTIPANQLRIRRTYFNV